MANLSLVILGTGLGAVDASVVQGENDIDECFGYNQVLEEPSKIMILVVRGMAHNEHKREVNE